MNEEERLMEAKTTTANTNGAASAATPLNITPIVQSVTTPPDAHIIKPSGTWPPPIYVDPNANQQERHYIEHRWHSQWDWYDKRASEAKKMYQFLQIVIGVGSVTVPVLIGFRASDPNVAELLTIATVLLSLTVAIAAAIENVKKYGDNWRNFRGAAEELLREKSLYDVKSGPYRKTKTPFLLFVQRCEEIMTKQNGSFLQLAEEVQQQGQQPAQVKDRNAKDDEDSVG